MSETERKGVVQQLNQAFWGPDGPPKPPLGARIQSALTTLVIYIVLLSIAAMFVGAAVKVWVWAL